MSIQNVFILLKPDCLKRGLAEAFLSKISSLNLDIRLTKKCDLTKESVRIIYKDCLDRHFYSDLEAFILSGHCIAVIVSGDNAIEKILKLKQRFRKEQSASWVNLTEEDIRLWEDNKHPHQRELNIKLTAENLVHSTNTENEFEEVTKSFFALYT